MNHWLQLDGTAPDVATTNTALAAVMATMGVQFFSQVTVHVAENNRECFTWHLQPNSAAWPEMDVRAIVNAWHQRQIHPQTPGLEPFHLLFLAGMYALESRRRIIEGEKNGQDWHVVHRGSGLCRAIRASDRTKSYDLISLTKDALLQDPNGHVTIRERKLAFAAQVVGFPVLRRTEAGFTITTASLTQPGLTFHHIFNAAGALVHYNQNPGLTPPACALPGAPDGYHPFQFAIQALFSFDQLHHIMGRTPLTAFLQNEKDPQKAAILRVDSTDDDLLRAAKHTGVRI